MSFICFISFIVLLFVPSRTACFLLYCNALAYYCIHIYQSKASWSFRNLGCILWWSALSCFCWGHILALFFYTLYSEKALTIQGVSTKLNHKKQCFANIPKRIEKCCLWVKTKILAVFLIINRPGVAWGCSTNTFVIN